uniref:26S proteasome regulatory subunit RPN2 n=1 Tax=Lygus hesperus TaxID=30085 RepID=A0A0A9YI21_LYGHE
MAKAKLWAQFTAIASIGVIHRGHVTEAMNVMRPYLPSAAGSDASRSYYEAGALYALGLIHAPLGVLRDDVVLNYLSANLYKYSTVSQMVHGASLGIGLTAMGLQNEELCDVLFTCITGGDALGGEAAAVGIGMVMMGSGNDTIIHNFENVAQEDNQKEKIIRGTSMGVALMNLGR